MKGTRDIFLKEDTRAARKACPQTLWTTALRKLDMLQRSERVDDLLDPPGNRLERLKGDRSGAYTVRVNAQYRVCFYWGDAGPEEVEIVDYH
jgi:toxin HigB-1